MYLSLLTGDSPKFQGFGVALCCCPPCCWRHAQHVCSSSLDLGLTTRNHALPRAAPLLVLRVARMSRADARGAGP